MSFRPKPGTECCTGEVNRIMPNYAGRMWMRRGTGLVAVLYGPNSVTTQAGRMGRRVTIHEETTYPFSDRVKFRVSTDGPTRFTLWLRVPGWCREPRLYLNDQPWGKRLKPGTFIPVVREFHDGDTLELFLPWEIRATKWPRGGTALEAGPLVFSLRIAEKWVVDRKAPNQSRDFPAWNLYPAGPFNFALAGNPAREALLVRSPAGADPWTQEPSPVELLVPVRRVAGWKLLRPRSVIREGWFIVNGRWTGHQGRVRGRFILTPNIPAPNDAGRRAVGPVEAVSLVPYGTTHLRLTVFPRTGK